VVFLVLITLSTQAFISNVYCCHLVSQVLYEILSGGLSPSSKSFPLFFSPLLKSRRRQDVAAACIFLATKTEECGRKLRDVAKVCQAKISGVNITQIADDSKVIA
jgi:hypothetical protein